MVNFFKVNSVEYGHFISQVVKTLELIFARHTDALM